MNNDAKRRATVPLKNVLTGELLIFVVEDDSSTRHFICSLLKYATTAMVVEASSPETARTIARTMGRPIDLLISDIDLGSQTTGVDLAHEFAANDPALKVLLMSGSDFPPHAIPLAWRFLAKPFPIAIFLECVNELCASVRPRRVSAA
jgi:DNA-binding NtrC family response regulator